MNSKLLCESKKFLEPVRKKKKERKKKHNRYDPEFFSRWNSREFVWNLSKAFCELISVLQHFLPVLDVLGFWPTEMYDNKFHSLKNWMLTFHISVISREVLGDMYRELFLAPVLQNALF